MKNGERTLPHCLESIKNQQKVNVEIIIIDSGSFDKTLEIARKFTPKIIHVSPRTFNHGLTRNLGTANAKGKLIFFTVQDAILTDVEMLYKMAKHFESEKVQAVCGHQAVIHIHNTNPVQWFRPCNISTAEARSLPKASMHKKDFFIQWDNVNAMYRKSILSQIPFRDTFYGEDNLWCYHALQNKLLVLYDPSLIVHHYHHNTFKYTFLNCYRDLHFFYSNYKFVKPSSIGVLFFLRVLYRVFLVKEIGTLEKIYWICYNYQFGFSAILSHFFFRLQLFFNERWTDEFVVKYCNVLQGKQK